MRKYLKFILSIILLAIILQPLLEYKEIDYSAFANTEYYSQYEEAAESGELAAIQNVQIVSVYKQKIINETSKIIQDTIPESEVRDIKIKIFEDSNKRNFGEIHSLYIDLVFSEFTASDEDELIKALSERLNLSKRKITITCTYNKAGD